jgi:DNA-binding beta-propeller fold protein YncE
VIKIDENITKSLYIVSNIKTGTLTVIDGLCNTILKEISVGKRPYNLALKDNNTIVVACHINNTISFVNCISGEIKQNSIPNNGIFQITTNKRIFVANTSEITIYDINLDKILCHISGFSAIIDLKLNKEGSMLYVLDTLLKELRVYRTDSYNLIYSFEKLGINPNYLLISEDDKTAYISTQNSILKIDIISKKIIDLILPNGSLTSGMILKDDTLYASNLGLNRIELINIITNKAYDFILTSTPGPTRLFITDDNTKLLVTNRNHGNHGSMDIIDIKSNALISSILMSSFDSQPYDVISLSVPSTYVPPVAVTNLQQDNQGITIITKKIFASYNENVNFPNININLPKDTKLPKDINPFYTFENIIFKPCIIVNNSEFRRHLSTTSGFSSIKFIARINYIIDYIQSNKKNSINGFFEKPIEIFFDTPKGRELTEFELNIKTTTNLTGDPNIINNVVCFGVTSRMNIKIIGEDEIYLTNTQVTYDNVNEHYKAFSGSVDHIFPEGTVIPF